MTSEKTSFQRFQRTWCLYANQQSGTARMSRYLANERYLFARFLRNLNYNTVVEAGCGNGQFLMPVVIKSGLNYWGIDFIPQAIDALTNRITKTGTKIKTICGDISNLYFLSQYYRIPIKGTVVAFPFNIIGTLDEPQRAINEVARSGYDIVAFTFRTNLKTNAIRKAYYERLGLGRIYNRKNESGVLFKTPEGLISYAYEPKIIQKWIREAGFNTLKTYFDPIGVMHYGCNKKNPTHLSTLAEANFKKLTPRS